MIHKIWANDKRFKPVEFYSGLNIILAERTIDSGLKDTRNGAGKTTLLNIVHFCLGADISRLNLPKNELNDWIFYISIDICGQIVIANRSFDKANIIEINESISNAPIIAEKDSKGVLFYKNEDWKKLLGKCLFNIQEDSHAKYSPTFRSLISYFVRRGVDAYTDPFKHFRNQKTFDLQIHNAFLLGLNWLHASEAQEIRDKENAANAIKLAIKAGISSNQGELEAERVRIERELNQEVDSIKSFQVHPQYKELQEQANKLTIRLHELSNKSLILQRKLERYGSSIKEEKPPDIYSVDKLFSEAGVHFSDNIKKSLDQAKDFHNTIIQNRKLFLESEVVQLTNELAVCEEDIKQSSIKRAELLQLLETHGALEEFSLLQERVVQKRRLLEDIKLKISNIKEIAQHNKDIRAAKIELETKLQRDYEQNRTDWEKAVTLFNDNSQALYDEPGNLIINTTDNGYKLDVEIQKSSSEGVGKMKIFCYDLMLVELMTNRNGINFLIHDSSIFDGVDSRQRALAIMHANKQALENSFQYICALNSDMIPVDDLTKEFHIDEYVRLVLKDQTPEDSILGFHFELSKKKPKDNS